jgi:hypothetical protein
MYCLIDFNDKSEGLYTLKMRQGDFDADNTPLVRSEMVTTDPDLETYATIVVDRFASDYSIFNIDMIRTNKISVETIKRFRHLVLLGGQWEITARLWKVHKETFEFTFGGGRRFFVSEFGLGEPVDE